MFEFESEIVCFVFPLSLFRSKNRACLSRGVQVTDVAWCATMRIMAGVGDLCRGPEIVAQVGYSVTGRSRGRVAPCAVCTGHEETRSAGFLVKPQNQGGEGFPSLGLKTGSYGLVIWASKSP
jgi:hypothetical protein